MATEKQLKTRLIQKHDTEANWNKATNFIPKDGELIIYDIDAANTHKRLKIGDGSTSIVNLPFINQYLEDKISTPDWNQSDVNAPDYIKNRTHYEDITYTTYIEEQVVNFDGTSNNYYIVASVPGVDLPWDWVPYIFTFDGVEYKCDFTDNAETGWVQGSFDDGTNFQIDCWGHIDIWPKTSIYTGEHTIKLVQALPTIKQLDEKFIPNFKENRDKLNYTNIAYGICYTMAGTAAKTVHIVGNTQWKLEPGATIVVQFSATNTASNPTLNVNGTGDKRIWYNTALLGTSSLNRGGYASRYITYVYDGTQYVFQGWSVDDASDTKVTQANTTSNTTYNVLLSYGAASTSSVTNTVNKSANLQFNPSTKTLTVENLMGNATSSDGINWGSW